MAKRFKIGDRVSVRETQLTGRSIRPSVYSYGTIIKPPPDLPQIPLCGGFHYVLIDGSNYRRLTHWGRLTHLFSEEPKNSLNPPCND